MWGGRAAADRGALHISLPGVHGYVAFRNGVSGAGCRSSLLVAVSLCGSTPISAIESLGLSGRGGQGNPCPEGCVLGPEFSEAFSQQLEFLLAPSSGGAQAVQFRPDPIEPALCRLVSSALGLQRCVRLGQARPWLRRDRPAAVGSVRLPERDRRRRRVLLRTWRVLPRRGAEHGMPAPGRRPIAICGVVHLCRGLSWWECNET
jgi:hypothetical protein